jgi:hypothetical protein
VFRQDDEEAIRKFALYHWSAAVVVKPGNPRLAGLEMAVMLKGSSLVDV